MVYENENMILILDILNLAGGMEAKACDTTHSGCLTQNARFAT